MSERKRNEARVRAALQELEAPEEQAAEERARRVVEAAFDGRVPSSERSRTALRAGAALVAAAGIAAFALTPAGADVREWIADRIDPGEEEAEPRLTSLPAPGELLVEAESGAWIVRDDGSRRRLGDYELASWSPRGRFVAVADGTELRAVDPVGNFRWSIEASAPIEAVDWSSDEGFRVAYLAGEEVRVVAGDGTDDVAVASARAVPPVWRPESDPARSVHQLAYVDRSNRVVLTDTDAGTTRWRTATIGAPVTSLEWSANGETLLVKSASFVLAFGAAGQPLVKGPLNAPAGLRAASLSPSGKEVAMVRDSKLGRELVLTSLADGNERLLYRTRSRARGAEFDEPVFSPDGEWILLPWRAADQWLFIRRDDRRVVAVADISRQFESGSSRESFPHVTGWCCAP